MQKRKEELEVFYPTRPLPKFCQTVGSTRSGICCYYVAYQWHLYTSNSKISAAEKQTPCLLEIQDQSIQTCKVKRDNVAERRYGEKQLVPVILGIETD